MLFNININQRAIIESGIKGVSIQSWCVFHVICEAIAGNWASYDDYEGDRYYWVSNKKILDELPILEVTEGRIRACVSELVDAGLIDRHPKCQSLHRQYLKRGVLADSMFSNPACSETGKCLHENEQVLARKQSSACMKTGKPIYKDDNSTEDNKTNTSIEPPTPLQGDAPKGAAVRVEPGKRSRTTARRTSTTEQSMMEYGKEIDSLNDLPPALDDVAAARREKYVRLVAWMQRDGRDATVMRMGEHLSFAQYERLQEEYGMTAYQIFHYLERLHEYTDRHKNLSVFGTVRHWWQDDGKKDRRPPALPPRHGQQETNTGSVSVQKPRGGYSA